MEKRQHRIYPVISLAAEHLAIGHLMRRNILAYKAPPNNEGYDLICIHPDPRHAKRPIRIQVKSRYQSDSNRTVLLKAASLDAFEYLMVCFLNVGYFYRKKPVREGARSPLLYTLPIEFVRSLHSDVGWQKLKLRGLDLREFEGERGIELVARDLGIEYPSAGGLSQAGADGA